MNGSRERNEVKRSDHPAFDPVTTLRSVPGCHCYLFTVSKEPEVKRSATSELKLSAGHSRLLVKHLDDPAIGANFEVERPFHWFKPGFPGD